jgi:hypothetical protein
MSRADLTYVDGTILGALVSAGPDGNAVRHRYAHSADAWMSSTIALVRCLQVLEREPAIGGGPAADPIALLRLLSNGIVFRPIPLAALAQAAPHRPLPQLSAVDRLELAAARIWRCHLLITNNTNLRDAALAEGIHSFSIQMPQQRPPQAMGDWRGRSPIPP